MLYVTPPGLHSLLVVKCMEWKKKKQMRNGAKERKKNLCLVILVWLCAMYAPLLIKMGRCVGCGGCGERDRMGVLVRDHACPGKCCCHLCSDLCAPKREQSKVCFHILVMLKSNYWCCRAVSKLESSLLLGWSCLLTFLARHRDLGVLFMLWLSQL